MNTFLVGGAVRDTLLNLPVNDRDYVVTGVSPNDMLNQGFTRVGNDFPVFLHPITKDEYALARTEQVNGIGYNDFKTQWKGVTLETDLKRRDLTINSIAMDQAGNVIDPNNGQQDLEDGVLRHVSDAFEEDAVRVLRVARFRARFNFEVAVETLELMSKMVTSGKLVGLTSERIFKELRKALKTDNPNLFFETLQECGALKVIFPEIHALIGKTQPKQHHPEGDAFEHTMEGLRECVRTGVDDVMVRFGVLVHDLGKGLTKQEDLPKHHGHESAGVPVVESFCNRLKTPKSWKELGMISSKNHLKFHRFDKMSSRGVLKFFKSCDAFRKRDRFLQFLIVSLIDANARGETKEKVSMDKVDFVLRCSDSANISVKPLVEKGFKGNSLINEIHHCRLKAVSTFRKAQ